MSSVPRVLAVLLVLLFGRSAFATTCTINGTVKIEPMDQYYCDPDVSGMDCSGWQEVNLDDKVGGSAAPMKHLVIEVWQNSNMLWRGVTSEGGSYTATFNLSGCTGQQVYIHKRFEAAHIDPPTGWLIRHFRVVGESGGVPSGYTWIDTYAKTLSGTTTTTNSLYAKTSNPSFYTQVANIYYTADSFVTATGGWSMTTPFSCLNPSECHMIAYESYSSGNVTTPLNYSAVGAPYNVFEAPPLPWTA